MPCMGEKPRHRAPVARRRLRRTARYAVWGIVLLLALTGCAGGRTAPKASPSSVAEPRAALLAAVAKSAGMSSRITFGDAGTEGNGAYDAVAKAAVFSMEVDGKTGAVTIASFGLDVYLSGFPGTSGKTLHLDVSRFAPDSSLLLVLDPMLGLRLLTAAAEVQRTPTGFHGTIDLTKVDTTGNPAQKVIVAGLAATAGVVAAVRAFDAWVDDQGRLTRFRTTFRSSDDGVDDEYELALADFGAAQTVLRPTEDVVEATADLYAGAGQAKG